MTAYASSAVRYGRAELTDVIWILHGIIHVIWTFHEPCVSKDAGM